MTAMQLPSVVQQGQIQAYANESLMPAMSIEQAVQRYNTIVAFAKTVMREGCDYGTIPGTERKSEDGTPSSKNHTLLKPGAEKLCTLFGLVPEFDDYRVVEDWEKGLFYYAYRCNLSRRGQLVASAIGSCNSREKKYVRVARLCPECGAPTIKRSKYPPRGRQNEEPGYYCHEKSGGCGREFAADDEKILGQRLEADPSQAADFINTIQKMAQKRAFVAAVLNATNASEFFTQDVEDMVDAEYAGASRPAGEPEDQRQPAEIFNEKWRKAIEARGLPLNNANSVLSQMLLKKNVTLSSAHPAQLRDLLELLNSGKLDAALRKEPAPPSASKMGHAGDLCQGVHRIVNGRCENCGHSEANLRQSDPDEPQVGEEEAREHPALAPMSDLEKFEATLHETAEAVGIDEKALANGVKKYLLKVGKVGKPKDLTGKERDELLAMVKAKAI